MDDFIRGYIYRLVDNRVIDIKMSRSQSEIEDYFNEEYDDDSKYGLSFDMEDLKMDKNYNRENRNNIGVNMNRIYQKEGKREINIAGSNLYIRGFGMDVNGNSVVYVGTPNERSVAIQTNQGKILSNTVRVHDMDAAEENINSIGREILNYVQQFGSPKLKSHLKVYKNRNESKKPLKEWKDKLQDTYKTIKEFEDYDQNYGIFGRLNKSVGNKFDSIEDMWEANPMVHGGTDPKELRILESKKPLKEGNRKGYQKLLTEGPGAGYTVKGSFSFLDFLPKLNITLNSYGDKGFVLDFDVVSDLTIEEISGYDWGFGNREYKGVNCSAVYESNYMNLNELFAKVNDSMFRWKKEISEFVNFIDENGDVDVDIIDSFSKKQIDDLLNTYKEQVLDTLGIDGVEFEYTKGGGYVFSNSSDFGVDFRFKDRGDINDNFIAFSFVSKELFNDIQIEHDNMYDYDNGLDESKQYVKEGFSAIEKKIITNIELSLKATVDRDGDVTVTYKGEEVGSMSSKEYSELVEDGLIKKSNTVDYFVKNKLLDSVDVYAVAEYDDEKAESEKVFYYTDKEDAMKKLNKEDDIEREGYVVNLKTMKSKVVKANKKKSVKKESYMREASLNNAGFFVIEKDGLYGIEDHVGNIVLEPKYSYIDDVISANGMVMVKDENGNKRLIDVYSYADFYSFADFNESKKINIENTITKFLNTFMLNEKVMKDESYRTAVFGLLKEAKLSNKFYEAFEYVIENDVSERKVDELVNRIYQKEVLGHNLSDNEKRDIVYWVKVGGNGGNSKGKVSIARDRYNPNQDSGNSFLEYFGSKIAYKDRENKIIYVVSYGNVSQTAVNFLTKVAKSEGYEIKNDDKMAQKGLFTESKKTDTKENDVSERKVDELVNRIYQKESVSTQKAVEKFLTRQGYTNIDYKKGMAKSEDGINVRIGKILKSENEDLYKEFIEDTTRMESKKTEKEVDVKKAKADEKKAKEKEIADKKAEEKKKKDSKKKDNKKIESVMTAMKMLRTFEEVKAPVKQKYNKESVVKIMKADDIVKKFSETMGELKKGTLTQDDKKFTFAQEEGVEKYSAEGVDVFVKEDFISWYIIICKDEAGNTYAVQGDSNAIDGALQEYADAKQGIVSGEQMEMGEESEDDGMGEMEEGDMEQPESEEVPSGDVLNSDDIFAPTEGETEPTDNETTSEAPTEEVSDVFPSPEGEKVDEEPKEEKEEEETDEEKEEKKKKDKKEEKESKQIESKKPITEAYRVGDKVMINGHNEVFVIEDFERQDGTFFASTAEGGRNGKWRELESIVSKINEAKALTETTSVDSVAGKKGDDTRPFINDDIGKGDRVEMPSLMRKMNGKIHRNIKRSGK